MKRTTGLLIVVLLAAAGGWMVFFTKTPQGRQHEDGPIPAGVPNPEAPSFSQPDNPPQSATKPSKALPTSNDRGGGNVLPQTAQARATTISQASTGMAGPGRNPRGTPSTPASSPQVSPALPASGYSGPRTSGGGPSTLSTGDNTAGSDVVMQTTAGGDVEMVIPAQASLPAALATGAAEANGSSGAAASSDASAVAADQIAEDFLNEVTPGGTDSSTSLQDWEDATYLADERYRSLKGHDAFLLYKLNAAKEALGSN